MSVLPFSTAEVESAEGPLIRVRRGPDGRPAGATAALPVRASLAKLWSVVGGLESYASRIPMMDKVEVDEPKVTVRLKFRVAIVSVGFAFTALATKEHERSLELRWVSGEPAGLCIRFDLVPGSDGTTVLYSSIGFDIDSLGWLVKYFLRHHPEIRYGIFTGSAFALADKMREAAEAK
jgi:hypothetical protein